MLTDMDEFMRAAFVIEFVGVLMVRPLFAGGLQLGEEKGRKWRESPVYLVGAIPLVFSFFYGDASDLHRLVSSLRDTVTGLQVRSQRCVKADSRAQPRH